jgi:hypothetical protein
MIDQVIFASSTDPDVFAIGDALSERSPMIVARLNDKHPENRRVYSWVSGRAGSFEMRLDRKTVTSDRLLVIEGGHVLDEDVRDGLLALAALREEGGSSLEEIKREFGL